MGFNSGFKGLINTHNLCLGTADIQYRSVNRCRDRHFEVLRLWVKRWRSYM